MKTAAASLLLFAVAALYAASPDATTSLQGMGPEAPRIEPFQRKIKELLEVLKQKKIIRESGLTEDEENGAINAILSSIRKDLRYLPDGGQSYKLEPVAPAQRTVLSQAIRNGKIIYFRMDDLGNEAATKFIADYHKILTAPGVPDGAILDLRYCRCFDMGNIGRIAAACFGLPTLESHGGNSAAKPINCAILIGPGTAGAPEALAWLTEKSRQIITIGAPSAGMPFKPEIIKLPDHSALLAPQIPAICQTMPAAPVKPVIEAPVAPRPATPEQTTEDACVMKACDLLISLKTFNQAKR